MPKPTVSEDALLGFTELVWRLSDLCPPVDASGPVGGEPAVLGDGDATFVAHVLPVKPGAHSQLVPALLQRPPLRQYTAALPHTAAPAATASTLQEVPAKPAVKMGATPVGVGLGRCTGHMSS